jgi:hypothetical protein
MLEQNVSEAMGAKVSVAFEYSPELRQSGGLTVIHCGIRTRPGGGADREYESGGFGEQFRDRPLLLKSRYLISAWAKPPEDQAILGAALRTFHDHPYLEFESIEEEEAVGYAGTPSIDLESVELAEHKTLADAYGMPLAPSVCYWVEYRLKSGVVTPIKRVLERVTDFRKIEG